MSADLGVCTMPGCLTKAEWVHGSPIIDSEGALVFPWHLCQECHETSRVAELALLESGMDYPEEELWVFEACRTRVQQLQKLEAIKKP